MGPDHDACTGPPTRKGTTARSELRITRRWTHDSSLTACDFECSASDSPLRDLQVLVAIRRARCLSGCGCPAGPSSWVPEASRRHKSRDHLSGLPPSESWAHGNPVTAKNLFLFIAGELFSSFVLRPNCCCGLRMVVKLRGTFGRLKSRKWLQDDGLGISYLRVRDQEVGRLDPLGPTISF